MDTICGYLAEKSFKKENYCYALVEMRNLNPTTNAKIVNYSLVLAKGEEEEEKVDLGYGNAEEDKGKEETLPIKLSQLSIVGVSSSNTMKLTPEN